MIRTIFARKLTLTAHVGQVIASNAGECTKLTGRRFSIEKSLEKRNLVYACINNISDDYKFAIIIAPPLPFIMGLGEGWGWGWRR